MKLGHTSVLNSASRLDISAKREEEGSEKIDTNMKIEISTLEPNNQRNFNMQETAAIEMQRTGTFGKL